MSRDWTTCRAHILPVAILAVILTVSAAFSARWVSENRVAFDFLSLQSTAFRWAGEIEEGTWRYFLTEFRFEIYYPPLYLLSVVATHVAIGFHRANYLVINVALLGASLLALYALASRYAGRFAGAAVVLLFAALPGVVYFFRVPGREIGTVPCVIFAIWALDASDRFKRRWPAAVYGVSLGIGLLFKWTLLGFLAAPTALVLALAARDFMRGDRDERRAIATNSVIAFGLPVLLAGWWYVGFMNWSRFLQGVEVEPAVLDSAGERATYYLSAIRALTSNALPLFLMAAGTLLIVFDDARSRVFRPARWFVFGFGLNWYLCGVGAPGITAVGGGAAVLWALVRIRRARRVSIVGAPLVVLLGAITNAVLCGLEPRLVPMVVVVTALGILFLVVVVRGGKAESAALLLTWLVSSYLVYTLIPKLEARYILPLLPAVVLLALMIAEATGSRRGRSCVVSAVALAGFVQFVSYAGGQPVIVRGDYTLQNLSLERGCYPVSGDEFDRLIETVRNDPRFGNHGRPINLAIHPFNPLETTAFSMNEIEFRIATLPDDDGHAEIRFLGWGWAQYDEFIAGLDRVDVLLVSGATLGPSPDEKWQAARETAMQRLDWVRPNGAGSDPYLLERIARELEPYMNLHAACEPDIHVLVRKRHTAPDPEDEKRDLALSVSPPEAVDPDSPPR